MTESIVLRQINKNIAHSIFVCRMASGRKTDHKKASPMKDNFRLFLSILNTLLSIAVLGVLVVKG